MVKDIFKLAVVGVILVGLTFSHGAAMYGGYKLGTYFGYVKGVAHRFLPWKREQDENGRRRIIPRPFNPGDAPAGSPATALEPTETELDILGSQIILEDEDFNEESNN